MSDLLATIRTGESETTEFKERWADRSALRELAAFANTRGGTLLVGVADDGEVTGWSGDDLDALASKITDSLRLHPSELRAGEVEGREVLVARVPEAQAPVAYRGRYYQRVGATTREIPPSELTRFLMERAGETWDAVEAGGGPGAIDDGQIEAFARLAEERLPHVSKNEGVASVLGKLNLVKGGRLTRAALLLFGAGAHGAVQRCGHHRR